MVFIIWESTPARSDPCSRTMAGCGPSVVGRVSIPNISLEPLLKVTFSSKKVLLYYPWHM